jgi:Regulator of chromosome condensation (RCC1) repeat
MQKNRLPAFMADSLPRATTWRNAIFNNLALLALITGSASAQQVHVVGLNQYGQRTVPAGLAAPVKVAAGWDFSLVATADGEVEGWGRLAVPDGMGPLVQVSAGMRHALGLKAGGEVVAWGSDLDGVSRIPADLPPALAVAAGAYHSLVLLGNGTVTAWGFNGNGRTAVPAGLRKVVAIAAGRDHSLALKEDGTVVAWGLNDKGQATVPAGLGGVKALAAGGAHSLALRRDGTVVAWGSNSAGQSTVPAGLRDVVSIAAGLEHSLALKSDGSIRGWGSNASGQLNFTGTAFSSIAAGASHSIALRGGPLLTKQPGGGAYFAGSEVLLEVASSDPQATYQWFHNGKAIAGATGNRLGLQGLSRADSGVYTVQARNALGVVTTSDAGTVAVRGRPLAALERQSDGAMSVLVEDEFGESIGAAAAADYRLLVSDNLVDWTESPRSPRPENGRLRFSDPDSAQLPKRFYKVVQD